MLLPLLYHSNRVHRKTFRYQGLEIQHQTIKLVDFMKYWWGMEGGNGRERKREYEKVRGIRERKELCLVM